MTSQSKVRTASGIVDQNATQMAMRIEEHIVQEPCTIHFKQVGLFTFSTEEANGDHCCQYDTLITC